MKKISFILVCCIIFFSVRSNAQDWQWGIAAHSAPGGVVMEEMDCSTVDKAGDEYTCSDNVYGVWSDTMYLGTAGIVDSVIGEPEVIAKTNTYGNTMWAIEATFFFANNMIADDSGNVYVFGIYDSACTFYTPTNTTTLVNPSWVPDLENNPSMAFLVKISSAGSVLWAENIATSARYVSGVITSAIKNHSGLGIDGASNIYISSDFSMPSVTIGATTLHNTSTLANCDSTDIFIVKYSPAGTPIWVKSFGGAENDAVYSMAVCTDGNMFLSWGSNSESVILDGTTFHGTLESMPGYNYYLINCLTKLDSGGNIVWSAQTSPHVGTTAMTTDLHDNLYTSGFIDSACFITPGGLAVPYAGFVAKQDSAGIQQWTNLFNGGRNNISLPIALDTLGNVWYACTFKDTSSVFSTADSFIEDVSGHILHVPNVPMDPYWADEAFVVKYCNNGTYLSSFVLPSGGDDYMGIGIDNANNLYFAGDFESNYMVFGPDTILLTSSENLFVAKYHIPAINVNPGVITGTDSLCIGDTLTLTDTVAGGTWLTSSPDIGTISGAGVVSGIGTGTVVISYYVPNSCSIAQFNIRILPLPYAGAIAGDTIVCKRDSILLIPVDTSTAGAWHSGNASIANIDLVDGVVTGVALGSTTITYSVTNSCGTASSYLPVHVVDCGTTKASLLNAATDIRIYPNPTGSLVFIDAPVTVNISLLTIDGKQIEWIANAKCVDLINLANGAYLLDIYNIAGTKISTEKIIKSTN